MGGSGGGSGGGGDGGDGECEDVSRRHPQEQLRYAVTEYPVVNALQVCTSGHVVEAIKKGQSDVDVDVAVPYITVELSRVNACLTRRASPAQVDPSPTCAIHCTVSPIL